MVSDVVWNITLLIFVNYTRFLQKDFYLIKTALYQFCTNLFPVDRSRNEVLVAKTECRDAKTCWDLHVQLNTFFLVCVTNACSTLLPLEKQVLERGIALTTANGSWIWIPKFAQKKGNCVKNRMFSYTRATTLIILLVRVLPQKDSKIRRKLSSMGERNARNGKPSFWATPSPRSTR